MIQTKRKTKIDKEEMRRNNISLILQLIKKYKTISKTELSKITSLTLPAVTSILNVLEQSKIVYNIGLTKTKRGRYPTNYMINDQYYHVVGVTIKSDKFKIACVNIVGIKIKEIKITFDDRCDPLEVLDDVAYHIESLLNELSISHKYILGIGVGIHGIVDTINGLSVYPPQLDWKNVKIIEHLESKLNFKVKIDNDCNTLALAEMWFGAGKDKNSFIVVNVDYGIGAGIVLDNDLFRGSNFGSGQIGHIEMIESGEKCSCGKIGCLETISSEPAILKSVLDNQMSLQFDSRVTNILDVYESAKEGSELAIQSLKRAGKYLGKAISILVNLFDPEKIIITGGITREKGYIIEELRETATQHSLNSNFKNLKVIESTTLSNAESVGAASLWIDALYRGELEFDNLVNDLKKEKL